MTTKDLRKLTAEDLVSKLSELKSEYVELEFNIRTAQDTNTAELKEKRKEIARVMTVLNEKDAVETTDVKEEIVAEAKEVKKEKEEKEDK